MEERLYRGEIMTVNVTRNSVFSDLTFSLLEDTGWYMAGMEQVDKLLDYLFYQLLLYTNLTDSSRFSQESHVSPPSLEI